MKRRVVITGVGTVTSLGHDARSSWRAVAEGQSGVLNYLNDPILKNSKPYSLGLVTKFDLAKWKVPVRNIIYEACNQSNEQFFALCH
jgi:3-oxoacyl-(acyl-carrier-protein) synthase